MKSFLSNKIFNFIFNLTIVILICLNLLLFGPRLVGYKVFSVLSGSMEPTYHTGSIIYVKESDYRSFKEGDVITFSISDNMVATHRIVKVVQDEDNPYTVKYCTKGDANDTEDGSLVNCIDVVGKPVFTIPYLGYIAVYMKKYLGVFLIIMIISSIVSSIFLHKNNMFIKK